ncbi:MAG: (Fe-S)-binding protein [Magnetococcales bacterium]|nr:(Fe-S)-binding protein [Magnetococcales bacterium]
MNLTKTKFKNAALCTHCGYCLPVCPTYRAENEESLSPRGRVSIVLALAKGELTPKQSSAALAFCLVCRACHAACPVGVRPAKLVLSARNLSPVPPSRFTRLLHAITNHHGLTSLAAGAIRFYQKRGIQRWVRRWKLLYLLPPLNRLERLIPVHRQEPIPAFPPPHQPPAPLRAALLCGCMARLFHPRVAPSAANLLHFSGIDVTEMAGFGCCGAPFRERGERQPFIQQAKKTLDAYRKAGKVDIILCDTSVCQITVRSYGRVLRADKEYAALAQEFCEKIDNLESFLAKNLLKMVPSGYQPEKSCLTFQDHCQVRHGMDILEPPRVLIQNLAGPLRELPRGDRCCGAGGDYQLHHPDLSHKIREDKLDAIAESQAQTVVGTNSGCLLNIEGGLEEREMDVSVRHLAEVLWKPLSQLK